MTSEFKLVEKTTGEITPHTGNLLHHLVQIGAKLNGRRVNLNTQIQHGDEITHQGNAYVITKNEPMQTATNAQGNNYTLRKTRIDKQPITEVIITNKKRKTKNAKLKTVNGMPLHTALIKQTMTYNGWYGSKLKSDEVKPSALIFSRLKPKSK